MVCLAVFPGWVAAIDLGPGCVREGVRPAVAVLSPVDQLLVG